MSKIALVRIGYQDYAVPLEELSTALAQFERFRKVSSRYEGGYVYWYDKEEADIGVTLVGADAILPSEPEKKPADPPTKPKAVDVRLFVAPSDANPISIAGGIPPLREFVNEHRDEEPL